MGLGCLYNTGAGDLSFELQGLRKEMGAMQKRMSYLERLIAEQQSADDSEAAAEKTGGSEKKAKTESKFGGYLRVVGHRDNNGRLMQSEGGQGFNSMHVEPETIPGTAHQSTINMTSREANLNWTVTAPDFHDWQLKGYVEGNYWDGNLRLRHAYIDLKKDEERWLFGQTWSSMVCAHYVPETIDFAAGTYTGGLLARYVQLRYENRIRNSAFRFGISLETDSSGNGLLSSNGAVDNNIYNNTYSGMPWRVYTFEYRPYGNWGRKAVYWQEETDSRLTLNVLDGKVENNTGEARDMQAYALSGIFGLRSPSGGSRKGALTFSGTAYQGHALEAWCAPGFDLQAPGGTDKGRPSKGYFVQLDYFLRHEIQLGIGRGVAEGEDKDGWVWTPAAGSTLALRKNSRDKLHVFWHQTEQLMYGLELADTTTQWFNTTTGNSTDEKNRRISLMAQYLF